MDIEFSGQYEKAHIQKTLELVTRPSRAGVLMRALLLLVIAASGAITVNAVAQGVEPTSGLWRLLPYVALAVYVIFQPTIHARMMANRIWKSPIAQQRIHGQVDENGYRVAFSGGEKEIPEKQIDWESVSRVVRTPDLTGLLTKEGGFTIFPRTFFKRETDWTRFNEVIDKKVA
jgi:hypothetical protein